MEEQLKAIEKVFQTIEQNIRDIQKSKDDLKNEVLFRFTHNCPLCGNTPCLMVNNGKYGIVCTKISCKNSNFDMEESLFKSVSNWNAIVE